MVKAVMNSSGVCAAMGCALGCLAASIFASAYGADLEVEVRGVKPHGGEIRAALFDNAQDFSLDLEVRAMVSTSGELSAGVFVGDALPRPPAQTATAEPDAKVIHLRFTNLPPGEYAVGVFQDRNNDGKLDMTLGKTPTEPWGLSNDARPLDRQPTFEEAKFAVPADGASIIINLR
jgi:uncharacterized protein (DUF2141 family)